MSFSSPPDPPGGPESEPIPPPSLPADMALWADSDVGLPLPAAPATSRPSLPPTRNESELATIGHIGRYALKYRIGEGGLGTVFAAHDPLLSRLIAIKTLNLEISAEERESFNALFLNEARAAAGLSHPHIVTVFDAGISQHDGENSAYIAMELLKGRDLRQLRQEGWRPSPAQAALIVRRVADALAYAHSKGVVHRDVKPANIFMVGRTQPRVLDFGIARVAHHHDSAGGSDIVAGSPYYMAPEQARQQTVDRRADVFSLGVVLYELLTDQKPFRGNTLSEITQAVIEHRPPPAHEVEPRVPRALSEITARAMEKNPEHRYRSARAFSRELRHWLEENPDSGDEEAVIEPPRPHRFTLALGLALGALVLGAALWFALSPARRAAAPEPIAAPAVVAPSEIAAAAPAAALPASASAAAEAAVAVATPLEPTAAGVVVPAPPAAATKATAPATPIGSAAAPPTTPRAAGKDATKEAPKETARDRKAREAREREARVRAAAPTATGMVRIAVSPWGQVEVDGSPAGTSPPLNELNLSEGRHQITLRNGDFPPHSVTVDVKAGEPVSLKHKFGS